MAQNAHIAIGSLAEHLYSYFSLKEVTDMLAQQPELYELNAWNLSVEEYVEQLNVAIAHISKE